MGEQWRAVVGYEGLYEVSDHGRVRGLDRTVRRGSGALYVCGVLLAVRLNPSTGYLAVTLRRDGRQRRRPVHVLVAAAFLGPRPSAGHQVCHGPGGKLDNRPANLRYDTRSANTYDSVRDGTHANASRPTCARRHPLDGPNLITRKGKWRGCRACRRASVTVTYLRGRGHTVTDEQYQAIADEKYRKIIAEGRAA